jgi:hypothetical protein
VIRPPYWVRWWRRQRGSFTVWHLVENGTTGKTICGSLWDVATMQTTVKKPVLELECWRCRTRNSYKPRHAK